jgi:hypothetical protein
MPIATVGRSPDALTCHGRVAMLACHQIAAGLLEGHGVTNGIL